MYTSGVMVERGERKYERGVYSPITTRKCDGEWGSVVHYTQQHVLMREERDGSVAINININFNINTNIKPST